MKKRISRTPKWKLECEISDVFSKRGWDAYPSMRDEILKIIEREVDIGERWGMREGARMTGADRLRVAALAK